MPQVSIRERVIRQVVAKLQRMTTGDSILLQNSDLLLLENGLPLTVEESDPYNGIFFQFVQRVALDHTKQFQGNAISVLDMDEFYFYQTGYLLNTLRVGLEFWYKMKAGEEASERLGVVLAELKRVFLSDTNLLEDSVSGNPPYVQLCENVRIIQSDYDIESPFDRVVSGFLQFDFMYRTNKENPYELM